MPADRALEALQGRFLESLSQGTRARLVGKPWQPVYPSIAEMMAPTARVSYFFNPGRELPVVGYPDHDLAFLFYKDMLAYLPVVRSYYPDGEEQDLRSPDGQVVARGYLVPAATAMGLHGVNVEVKGIRARASLRAAAWGEWARCPPQEGFGSPTC
ncbi:MAG: hypothetical protein ACJ78Q_00815 [Chloroflexia bacterium]